LCAIREDLVWVEKALDWRFGSGEMSEQSEPVLILDVLENPEVDYFLQLVIKCSIFKISSLRVVASEVRNVKVHPISKG
jgi:hypothetical protein